MAMPKVKRISMQDFMQEILNDLPELILQYPRGIYTAELSEWYGESIQRVQNACQQLAEEHKIHYLKSARRAFYVLPLGHKPIDYFPELSTLQGKLMLHILKQHRQKHLGVSDPITTSYAALSKILDASYGGIRSVIQRCADLKYITILGNPGRGLQESLHILPNFEVLRWTINPPLGLLPPSTTTTTTTVTPYKENVDGP